jgi:hypothetical protein
LSIIMPTKATILRVLAIVQARSPYLIRRMILISAIYKKIQ